jgi:tetratricopeptide repeat protein
MLGVFYADQGKLDEAEKMYQRALQGYEKAWGPDHIHISTLDTVNNLGVLYTDQGKLDEAERCSSGPCKDLRRHGAQIIHQLWRWSTTWALSTNPRASWTRPRRCIGEHWKDTRRHLVRKMSQDIGRHSTLYGTKVTFSPLKAI